MTYWAIKRKRYGYRRITKELREQGHKVNHKRIYRLWTSYKMTLRPKRRRKRGVSKFHREVCAQRPNQVWSYDFMHDLTLYGRKLKLLNIIDEFTREVLTIQVRKSISSKDVIEILKEVIAERGVPEFIRSDNGPEFVAKKLRQWAKRQGSQTIYIEPGHPWENGFVESFNGKFREECLNMEVLRSRAEAQVIADRWKRFYNTERFHSSLGYKTPVAFRRLFEASASATPRPMPRTRKHKPCRN